MAEGALGGARWRGTTGPTRTCAGCPKTGLARAAARGRCRHAGLTVEITEDQNGVAPFLPLPAIVGRRTSRACPPSSGTRSSGRRASSRRRPARSRIVTATAGDADPVPRPLRGAASDERGAEGRVHAAGDGDLLPPARRGVRAARDLPPHVHRGRRACRPPGRSGSASAGRSPSTTPRSTASAGSLAPGMVLVAEDIRLAIEDGCAAFDLLKGDYAYKYRFGAVPRAIRRLSSRARRARCSAVAQDRRRRPPSIVRWSYGVRSLDVTSHVAASPSGLELQRAARSMAGPFAADSRERHVRAPRHARARGRARCPRTAPRSSRTVTTLPSSGARSCASSVAHAELLAAERAQERLGSSRRPPRRRSRGCVCDAPRRARPTRTPRRPPRRAIHGRAPRIGAGAIRRRATPARARSGPGRAAPAGARDRGPPARTTRRPRPSRPHVRPGSPRTRAGDADLEVLGLVERAEQVLGQQLAHLAHTSRCSSAIASRRAAAAPCGSWSSPCRAGSPPSPPPRRSSCPRSTRARARRAARRRAAPSRGARGRPCPRLRPARRAAARLSPPREDARALQRPRLEHAPPERVDRQRCGRPAGPTSRASPAPRRSDPALRQSFTNVSCTRSCAAASFPSITIPSP